MARRRTKKKTHAGAQNAPSGKPVSANQVSREPKNMVIRIGGSDVGPSISQLVKDVRSMMEPNTASRLKERRANRLRDYLAMAGPLGVSHLLLFSRSTSGNTNLRLAITPRGPTLHFRVEKYSLCKDIRKALKHPKGGGKEYLTAPLLVMNNFATPATGDSEPKKKVPRHLESLTTTMFQSLFPPIAPQTTPLSSIRRVLLLNREKSTKSEEEGAYILNLRHYAITTKATGISRPLRRLNVAEKRLNSQSKGKKKSLPNLGNLEDIADYMIGGETGEGYMTDLTSGSEVDTDAEVEILESTTRKVLSRKEQQRKQDSERKGNSGDGHTGIEKRAVKLIELGPRLKLRMTKVEEGVCSGKTMWHEYIQKSTEELKEMDRAWEKRRREKEERKRIQKDNVERKKIARGAVTRDGENVEDDDDDMNVEEWDSEGLEGDAEMELNEKMETNGHWEDEEHKIAAG